MTDTTKTGLGAQEPTQPQRGASQTAARMGALLAGRAVLYAGRLSTAAAEIAAEAATNPFGGRWRVRRVERGLWIAHTLNGPAVPFRSWSTAMEYVSVIAQHRRRLLSRIPEEKPQ